MGNVKRTCALSIIISYFRLSLATSTSSVPLSLCAIHQWQIIVSRTVAHWLLFRWVCVACVGYATISVVVFDHMYSSSVDLSTVRRYWYKHKTRSPSLPEWQLSLCRWKRNPTSKIFSNNHWHQFVKLYNVHGLTHTSVDCSSFVRNTNTILYHYRIHIASENWQFSYWCDECEKQPTISISSSIWWWWCDLCALHVKMTLQLVSILSSISKWMRAQWLFDFASMIDFYEGRDDDDDDDVDNYLLVIIIINVIT